MGAFQGKLNPISGKAIYETCAVPSYCMDVRIGFLLTLNWTTWKPSRGKLEEEF